VHASVTFPFWGEYGIIIEHDLNQEPNNGDFDYCFVIRKLNFLKKSKILLDIAFTVHQ
jgi:hypothetical protein